MAELKFNRICKDYDGGKRAVDDFCLDVVGGEFVVIVGPSGCGKTTLLRMIAGLERITSGELYIEGKLANNQKPSERGAAMVFQDNALFPQMTVYQNMAFGLGVKKTDKAETDKRVRAAAEVLGITDILQSRPGEISGGQRRRVALGRGLADEPKVFLLDEPLWGLDAQLRAVMRGEIIRLHRATGATFIYVTHDQAEAMTMGTRIVVMNEGKIQQADTPDAVYNTPVNKFTAGFLGLPQMNFFSGTLFSDGKNTVVQISGASPVKVPATLFADIADEYKTGEPLTFGFRADAVTDSGKVKYAARLEITVSHAENLGAECYIYGDFNGACVAFKALPTDKHQSGERVAVWLDLTKAHVFDENGNSVRTRN